MNTENLTYVKNHYCNTDMIQHRTATLAYQPIGTLLWVKLPSSGDIVRLRCERVEMDNENKCLIHHYKGANGYNYIGNAFALRDKRGYFVNDLYESYEDCLKGIIRYKRNDSKFGTRADNLDLYGLIYKTYGSAESVAFEGCWGDVMYINSYINRNGSIERMRVPFALWIDKDGAHFNVKEFDNGTAFPTYNEAFATYKPKVIDFGNDDGDVVVKKETTITITITEEQRTKLKNMGII